MSELCEHETFKDVCGICHRDGVITRLRAENERLEAENKAVLAANREAMLYWNVLKADYERLRAALEQLLACPAIADGNHNDPAWACHETAAAETFARKVLARAALEDRHD